MTCTAEPIARDHNQLVTIAERIATRLATNRAVRDELVGCGLVKLVATEHTFDPCRGAFLPWANVVLKRAMIDELRKDLRHHGVTPLDGDVPFEETSPVERLIRAEENALLIASLRKLEPADRLLLELQFFEGLSAVDVAARVGSSAAAVRRRVHRMLSQRLASLLRPTSYRELDSSEHSAPPGNRRSERR